MNLMDVFKKQGGLRLLQQYCRSGAFVTAVCEFLLLGKTTTALEILRLSATFKARKKLEKKYAKCIENFSNQYQECAHMASNKIWICWFQGIENAPQLVKACYSSVKHFNSDKDIIVITADNMDQYVTFPDYILTKWKKGIITHTHMTDLLRLELLEKYGGMWLDATVFCTSSCIPKYFFESDLFFYQMLKPGKDGNANYISSWLMSAKTNNKIISATKYLCYEYWKDNDSMWDYFLLHDFMSMVLDAYPEEWHKVVPRDNATPHILLLRIFDVYDELMWKTIVDQTPFHKLSYKLCDEQMKLDGTFFRQVIKLGEDYK